MQIDVISDTVCPWCYIGKKRLETALAQRPDIDFNIVWRPFQLHPELPEDGVDRKEYSAQKFGDAKQAKGIFDSIAATGKKDGIDFDFTRQGRLPNTLNSHRLNYWAHTAGVQDEVVELLFQKYFLEGADIGDKDVLVEIAGEAGMDTEVVSRLLDSDNDRELVLKEEMTGRQMGVSGVPCFVIDHKYALVGAQDPEMLLRAIDQALAENGAEDGAEDAAEREAAASE